MAKISNTLSYPNQSPIEGADYLIGTAANSNPIQKQTKTFTLQAIAEFVIDEAFDGNAWRLPVFTANARSEGSNTEASPLASFAPPTPPVTAKIRGISGTCPGPTAG